MVSAVPANSLAPCTLLECLYVDADSSHLRIVADMVKHLSTSRLQQVRVDVLCFHEDEQQVLEPLQALARTLEDARRFPMLRSVIIVFLFDTGLWDVWGRTVKGTNDAFLPLRDRGIAEVECEFGDSHEGIRIDAHRRCGGWSIFR